MNKIHTIEPLTSFQQDILAQKTKLEVVQLDRKDFLSNINECQCIETLICRDRDQVSEILDSCPNLKLIFIVNTGVEKLPFAKLKEKGIVVCNTGGINAPIMSEYVLGAILQHSTRIKENILNQAKHHWKKFQCVDSLSGKKILIVGAGRTGQLIACKAKAFGMNVTGVKKHLGELPFFDKIVSLNALDKSLEDADYVVCVLPLTPDTYQIFDYSKFCKMKETAVFINISRGKLCVEEDIIKALDNHCLDSVVLDVFENEPLPADSPLWDCPNVIITPHSSGRLEDFMTEAIRYAANNIFAFINGLELPNKVNLENGY